MNMNELKCENMASMEKELILKEKSVSMTGGI